MRSANTITETIISSEKEQKFQRMMKHQEKIIEDAIRQEGVKHGNRLFVFSDREYFHGIEAPWYGEFYNRAKRECEDAGYKVSGMLIYW